MERLEIKRITDKLMCLAEKYERKVEFEVTHERNGLNLSVYDVTQYRENPARYSKHYICKAVSYEYADDHIKNHFSEFEPREMTFEEVEEKLGCKLRLVVDMETVKKLKPQDGLELDAKQKPTPQWSDIDEVIVRRMNPLFGGIHF